MPCRSPGSWRRLPRGPVRCGVPGFACTLTTRRRCRTRAIKNQRSGMVCRPPHRSPQPYSLSRGPGNNRAGSGNGETCFLKQTLVVRYTCWERELSQHDPDWEFLQVEDYLGKLSRKYYCAFLCFVCFCCAMLSVAMFFCCFAMLCLALLSRCFAMRCCALLCLAMLWPFFGFA